MTFKVKNGLQVGTQQLIDADGDIVTSGYLHITGNTDLASTGDAVASGMIQIGPTAGVNTVIDANEIQGRNNGAASTLNMNILGGNLQLGEISSSLIGISGTTTISSNNSPTLIVNRSNASVNAAIELKNTAGSMYIGNANGTTFAIDDDSDLTTGPLFTVDNTGATKINASSSSAGLLITQAGTGNALVVEDSTTPDSTPLVVDNTGKLIIGNTTTLPTGESWPLQLQGTSSTGAVFARFSADTVAPVLSFVKSRNTTLGSYGSATLNNDALGQINFNGDYGSGRATAAQILSESDGTANAAAGSESVPGRLVFKTLPANNTSLEERFRISSTGLSTFTGAVVVNANTSIDALRITQTGTGNAIVVEDSTNPDSTPFVVNANGEVGVGTASPAAASLQLGGDVAYRELRLRRSIDATTAQAISFYKTRGTEAAPTAVSSGDTLGSMIFSGHNNSTLINGASITSSVDTTLGSTDMPGRLTFNTTSVGGTSVTERMRIDSSGRVIIGGTSSILVGSTANAKQLQVHGTTFANTGATFTAFGTDYPVIVLGKSAGATIGTYTATGTGVPVGELVFAAANETDLTSQVSRVRGATDGSVTGSSSPGRLSFETTSTGYTTLTERMRIDSTGRILFSTDGTTSTTAAHINIVGVNQTASTTSQYAINLDHTFNNNAGTTGAASLMGLSINCNTQAAAANTSYGSSYTTSYYGIYFYDLSKGVSHRIVNEYGVNIAGLTKGESNIAIKLSNSMASVSSANLDQTFTIQSIRRTARLLITAASSTSTTMTFNYAAQPATPFVAGNSITISGMPVSGYNGTFTVTSCNTTTVVVSSTANPGAVTPDSDSYIASLVTLVTSDNFESNGVVVNDYFSIYGITTTNFTKYNTSGLRILTISGGTITYTNEIADDTYVNTTTVSGGTLKIQKNWAIFSSGDAPSYHEGALMLGAYAYDSTYIGQFTTGYSTAGQGNSALYKPGTINAQVVGGIQVLQSHSEASVSSGTSTYVALLPSLLTIGTGDKSSGDAAIISADTFGAMVLRSYSGSNSTNLALQITYDEVSVVTVVNESSTTLAKFDRSGNLILDGNVSGGQTTIMLTPGTADGTDDLWAGIVGGGQASTTRGGAVYAYGNENSAEAGNVRLIPGAVSGAHVSIEGNILMGASNRSIEIEQSTTIGGNMTISAGRAVTTSSASASGYSGGTMYINPGDGSANTYTGAAAATGGAGGTFTLAAGIGGACTGAHAYANTGGASGALTIKTDTGGDASGSTVSNTGGAAGTLAIQGGTGGAATGSGTLQGGSGGRVSIVSGSGGAGGNSNAGNIVLDTGIAQGTGTANILIGTTSTTGRNKVIQIGNTATTTDLKFYGEKVYVGGVGAALATSATTDFPYMPSMAGAPTGAVANPSGYCAMVVDTTNSRLYVRVGSAWKYASLV